MRATLEVKREDGASQLYWNGRRMLIAKGLRDEVDRLRPPCTVEGDVDDAGGAPTVVRLHAVKKPKTSVEDLLRSEKWDEALAAIGEVADGAAAPRLLVQRLRAFIGRADAEKAKVELRRLLALTRGSIALVDLCEVTEVIGKANLYGYPRLGDLQRTLGVELAAFLKAHPELRIGRTPKQLWGGVPIDLWPPTEILEQLAHCVGNELRELLVVARTRAPGDPRIAAAASKLVRLEEDATRLEEERWNANEFARMFDLLTLLARRVRIQLPTTLHRRWGDVDGERGAGRPPIDFLVLGARGLPTKELIAIATQIRDRHFTDEPPPTEKSPTHPFIPVAKDGAAWLGIYTVAIPTAHDYAVLRVDDSGVTVVAPSTEEWLAPTR